MTWRVVVATVLMTALAMAAAAGSAERVRVGDRPSAVREHPSERAAIVATVGPGSQLQAFDGERDWLWVVVPTEPGQPTRAGWINRRALADPATPAAPARSETGLAPSVPARPSAFTAASLAVVVDTGLVSGGPAAASAASVSSEAPTSSSRPPSLVELAEAARAASAAADVAKRATSATRAAGAGSAPPDPVGGLPGDGSSVLADWILPRALRANFGFNYQSARVRQALGAMDERLRGGVVGIAAALAILDPRILTVDFSGDLQLSTTTSRAPLASFRNRNGLSSYRVDFGILTGLKAPLRVFADRISSSSDLVPSGATLDPVRRTHGVRKGLGFVWDVNAERLPRIQLSASAGSQDDERNYLFGYSSRNDERRAEIRASRDHARGRYEVNFTHGDVAYDVPAAGVRSQTVTDLLQAAGRLTPSARLSVDLHARATRFQFGVGGQDSRVSGAGGDVAARYRLAENLAATARYSYSNNAFEAALSGRVDTTQPGATPVTTTAQLQQRTRFHDGEARLEYSTSRLTVAALMKTVSFGVPASLSSTLSELTTGGGLVRAEQSWRGVSWHAGVDASGGRARSNRNTEEPYREAGAEAGINANLGAWARLAADATMRRTGRLAFFPVNLDARNANLRFETLRPGWARARATVTRYDNLRDVLFSDSRDRHTGYTLGLAGGRYDLSVEIDQTDTHSLLLAPTVLGSRPDVAILIASRPDLFRNLLAAGDRSRGLALQLRPIGGLHLEVRGRRQEQVYPGLFGVRLNGAQAWASYQVRDVQLEFGWEYFDSFTSFGNVRDRRLYVRVRRDVTFF